jgi:hypothetical protein
MAVVCTPDAHQSNHIDSHELQGDQSTAMIMGDEQFREQNPVQATRDRIYRKDLVTVVYEACEVVVEETNGRVLVVAA